MPSPKIENLHPEVLGTAFGRAATKAFHLLWLPALEFFALRLFLKHGLGLKFGWRYFTDWDLVLPVPFALTLVLLVLEEVRPVRLRWSRSALAFNLVALAAFLAVNRSYDALASLSPWWVVSLWTALALATMGSAVAVRVGVEEFRGNRNRWVFLPGLLLAASVGYSGMLLNNLWPVLSGWAASGSCTVLSGVLEGMRCFVATDHGPRMIIRHDLLTVAVGRGCGGLDGFFLLFYLMMVLWLIVPRWFTATQWAMLTLVGFPLMYALNVVRICGFFAFAVLSHRWLGSQISVDVMLTLFHTHAGWVLYFVGLFSYLRLASRLFAGPVTSPRLSSVFVDQR